MSSFYKVVGHSLSLVLFLCLTACGYRAGTGGITDCYTSICIPVVDGDVEGHLTAEIVRELSSSSRLCYQQDGGDLILSVKVVELRERNVGYRFERSVETDEPTDRIVPTEGRLTAVVDVCVTESASGTTLIGPVRLASSVDYDHDYYTHIEGIPRFSLGQLDDTGVARDVAALPLDQALAKRIVEYINSYW